MQNSPKNLAATPRSDWAPAACTLPTIERPVRMAEFDQVFAEAVREVHRLTPTTLELVLPAVVRDRATDLAARETKCCSFFQFMITEERHDRVRMRISVPRAHVDVLDALAERYVR